MSSVCGLNTKALECTWEIQRNLSRFQAVPVVGPLIFSPLKAVVSLVQLVVGFVIAILALAIGMICCSDKSLEVGIKAFAQSGMGLLGLAYSIANMLTLGIVAFCIEQPCRPPHN